ncbi:hypothetical protein CEP53_004755 [Fusarium sp. AF-6]|nr:hypothetical protein CEP53_004755 [Fusarium sp. AF-6]
MSAYMGPPSSAPLTTHGEYPASHCQINADHRFRSAPLKRSFQLKFGNNFATDLAPIIALFGEQVTKQFLSESTTILDTIIFAVGPLGIITAIVSCIRVSGSSFLKREKASCEDKHGMTEFAPFPNLALNIGVQKAQTSILTLWIAAVFGLLVQSSFFGYTTWAMWYHPTFYEDEKASNTPLFFTFTIAGTASIIIGMALCATLIDRNSKEQRLVLSPTNETGKPRLPEYRIFWLQPGGQRIGDQEFDAFACNEAKTEYIASWNDRKAPVPILLVWLGKTLDDLNLDGTESRREAFELALTLDQRFNLGESSVPVRKQLLRWAIESDCTGLVEDLWFAERNNPWAESAFSTGSDELFWAASLRSDSHDMINTIMFLLEVVEMNQSASLECRGELHQSWWETSPKRDLSRVKYEQVSNMLAAAIICHNGLDVVELLVYDLDRRDRLNPKYVCEAIESALEHGSLETFTCLITNAVQWRFSYSLNFGLLPILAEWGLEQQTEARLQSDGGELFGKEFLGSLL